MNQVLFFALSELNRSFEEIKEQMRDWDRHFLVDNLTRFDKYGEDTYFSPKQAERVLIIYEQYKKLITKEGETEQ